MLSIFNLLFPPWCFEKVISTYVRWQFYAIWLINSENSTYLFIIVQCVRVHVLCWSFQIMINVFAIVTVEICMLALAGITIWKWCRFLIVFEKSLLNFDFLSNGGLMCLSALKPGYVNLYFDQGFRLQYYSKIDLVNVSFSSHAHVTSHYQSTDKPMTKRLWYFKRLAQRVYLQSLTVQEYS